MIRGEHQKLVVDSIVWGFKHTERNISEMGLEILFDLLQHIARHPDVAPGFYQVRGGMLIACWLAGWLDIRSPGFLCLIPVILVTFGRRT